MEGELSVNQQMALLFEAAQRKNCVFVCRAITFKRESIFCKEGIRENKHSGHSDNGDSIKFLLTNLDMANYKCSFIIASLPPIFDNADKAKWWTNSNFCKTQILV